MYIYVHFFVFMNFSNIVCVYANIGGAVTQSLVRSSPGGALWILALFGDVALSS